MILTEVRQEFCWNVSEADPIWRWPGIASD
jgi:hypothetical protein